MSELATVSLAEGYALSSPAGHLMPHSFRRTKAEAIASVFPNEATREAYWAAAQRQGMAVQHVYARIFTPLYFAKSASEKTLDQKSGAA